MTTIAVTGGSGGAGRAIINDLRARGYITINIDQRPLNDDADFFKKVDVTDYGQVLGALMGADAVVHMAADPSPDHNHYSAHQKFHNNTLGCYNVFQAAAVLGIKKVVWGSSETIHGYPFQHVSPLDMPTTEVTPAQPQNGYALSKILSEQMAEHMAKLYGLNILGLRFSNILYNDINARDNYHKIPSYWPDLSHRKFNLWSYVDVADAAQATRLALESTLEGAHTFIIAADDTLMNVDSKTLLQAHFPDVECPQGFGEFQSFISSAKAKQLLGYAPEVSWRDILNTDGSFR